MREKSKTAETSFRLPHRPHTLDLRDVSEAEPFQRRKVEFADRIAQMGQGMRVCVAMSRRIAQGSDAQAINHQHNDASNHDRTISEADGRLGSRLKAEVFGDSPLTFTLQPSVCWTTRPE